MNSCVCVYIVWYEGWTLFPGEKIGNSRGSVRILYGLSDTRLDHFHRRALGAFVIIITSSRKIITSNELTTLDKVVLLFCVCFYLFPGGVLVLFLPALAQQHDATTATATDVSAVQLLIRRAAVAAFIFIYCRALLCSNKSRRLPFFNNCLSRLALGCCCCCCCCFVIIYVYVGNGRARAIFQTLPSPPPPSP